LSRATEDAGFELELLDESDSRFKKFISGKVRNSSNVVMYFSMWLLN